MEPMVLNWATRYYYTGMGLPAPANANENPRYEESFKTLLADPISKLLGKETTTAQQEITSFLQQYQALGIKSPFYTLPYLAEHFSEGGDWKKYVSDFIQKTSVCVGVVNGGKAMHVYSDGKKALGVFPYAVHILGSKDIANQGTDILNDLIFGADVMISDEYITALKEICKISKKYEEAVLNRKVEIEHFLNGQLSTEPIPVVSPAFPPYEVRKLFRNLPEVNLYDSKHMQAYMYASQTSQLAPGVFDYLKTVMNQVSVTESKPESKNPGMPNVDETPGAVSCSDPDKLPDTGNLFAVPEEGVQFETLGDLLDYYVRDGYLDKSWTVGDTIYYFSLPDDDPYSPAPVYNFDTATTSQDNKNYLLKILEHMNLVNEETDTSVMTVNHLLTELRKEGSQIRKEDLHSLLKTLLRICAVKSTRDVMSIKKGETDFSYQVVRQAKAMSESGIPLDRTIGEIIDGQERTPTADDLAALAYKLELPRDLTISDIMNGMTEHKDDTVSRLAQLPEDQLAKVLSEPFLEAVLPIVQHRHATVSQFNSLLELATYRETTQSLKDEIAEVTKEQQKISSISDLVASSSITEELRQELTELMVLKANQKPTASPRTLDDVLQSDLLPTDLNVELAQLLNKRNEPEDRIRMVREELEVYDSLEQLVQVGVLPERLQRYAQIDSMQKLLGNNILTYEFKHELAQELKGAKNSDSDFIPDFQYEVAEILLKGVRKYLQKITPKMSFKEQSQYRSKAVPIFYQFISVLASKPDGIQSLDRELTKLLDTADEALKPLIQEAYNELQQHMSGSSS